MDLTRYDPWARLNQLQKELDRLFDMRTGFFGGEDSSSVATVDWAPAVDIKEEASRFVVLADIPGVDPKDIEISVDNGMLAIKGERLAETKEERETFRRIERTRGTFYRRFSLPDSADLDKITAKGANGVLEISIPKHEKAQPRRISVES
ncbi:MAG TPA: Hsp20/alpha crystallin family protein [Candidatus Competibacteraceae bacterium]|nr:Hsp20/alpha crystallin family protein [Candidatus Competibacteraceae bacterium]